MSKCFIKYVLRAWLTTYSLQMLRCCLVFGVGCKMWGSVIYLTIQKRKSNFSVSTAKQIFSFRCVYLTVFTRRLSFGTLKKYSAFLTVFGMYRVG